MIRTILSKDSSARELLDDDDERKAHQGQQTEPSAQSKKFM